MGRVAPKVQLDCQNSSSLGRWRVRAFVDSKTWQEVDPRTDDLDSVIEWARLWGERLIADGSFDEFEVWVSDSTNEVKISRGHGRVAPKACPRCGAASQGGAYCPNGCGRV